MAIKSRKEYRRFRIKQRVRKIINGTPDRPRMTVFRSCKEIYVQLIDDQSGKTLIAASSMEKAMKDVKGNKTEVAKQVGKLVAEKAVQAGEKAYAEFAKNHAENSHYLKKISSCLKNWKSGSKTEK